MSISDSNAAYKQVVIKHPNGRWCCWYAPVEQDVTVPPADDELTFGRSLFAVLRRSRKHRPNGPVLFTYMKDYSKDNG